MMINKILVDLAQSLPSFFLQPSQFGHCAGEASIEMRLVLDDCLNRLAIGQNAAFANSRHFIADADQAFLMFGEFRRGSSRFYKIVEIIAERLTYFFDRHPLRAIAWNLGMIESDDELGHNSFEVESRRGDFVADHAVESPMIARGTFGVGGFERPDGVKFSHEGIAVLHPSFGRFKGFDHGIERANAVIDRRADGASVRRSG